MSAARTPYRFLFAGGGTGGHLFPAVAVAERIRALIPEAEILFVGTKNKIESTVVPKLGFQFKDVWITGFSRKQVHQNLLFPLRLGVSLLQALKINIDFRPKVAIGTGGYAAGPAIWASSLLGAKILLLEQNSYPGVTTRILSRYADEIHLSFEASKKYFTNKEKLFVTGNPMREDLKRINREEAINYFSLNPSKRTVTIIGGSLGAGTLNKAAAASVRIFEENNIQVIWQTGKYYYKTYESMNSTSVKVYPFIDQMNYAYSACDLLVSRAGATTISEILNLAIPAILIPSPNVAENHQYTNAKSLLDNDAAVLIDDSLIDTLFLNSILNTIKDDNKLKMLKENTKKLSAPDASDIIARRAINYIRQQ